MDDQRSESGTPGSVTITSGRGNMPKIVLAHPSGASAEVYPYGAHVTSWKSAAGDELLFLSQESLFEPGSAMRGGIPVVFPQFADEGPLPKHGLVRTREWPLVRTEADESGTVSAELEILSTAETYSIWPHRFRLILGLILNADSLTVRLTAMNTGDDAFDFQAVLHTYFSVADIERTAVQGLEGVKYIDSLRDRTEDVETRTSIRFSEETDRIYVGAPDALRLDDEANGRTVTITKQGMPDAVVWNPWVEKSRRLSDFGDDEYRRMVCIETGVIAPPRSLAPGGQWTGETMFSVG